MTTFHKKRKDLLMATPLPARYFPTLLAVIFFLQGLAGQSYSHRFVNLSVNEGLSQATVQAVLQDHRGFMWFGTQEGLNRFDGYRFAIYRNDADNPASLSDNRIESLFEDPAGRLWVGTREGGLNLYDPQKESFRRFVHQPDNPASLPANNVLAIFTDHNNVLWVGTTAGLSRAELPAGGQLPENLRFEHFQTRPGDPGSLSHNSVSVIFQDDREALWVGTWGGGINLLRPGTDRFERLPSLSGKSNEARTVRAICQDREGFLWIGTLGGLDRYHPGNLEHRHFSATPGDQGSLSHNWVTAIREDQQGNLWIGTLGGGLNFLSRKEAQNPTFAVFQQISGDPLSLNSNDVQAIATDSAGSIWVGTRAGISRLDRQDRLFHHFQHQPNSDNSLSANQVWAITEDARRNLWIGTLGGGLSQMREGKQPGVFDFRNFTRRPGDVSGIGSDAILSLHEDNRGRLWIGTRGNGLDRYDRQTGRFTHFRHDGEKVHSLSHDWVTALWSAPSGDGETLWIGTWGGGLNRFEPSRNTFRHFLHQPENPNSLSHNGVRVIRGDSRGNLWIGTEEGLNRFDPKTELFTHYRHQNGQPGGLSNNWVKTVYIDPQGPVWVGTNNGLNRLDPASGAISQYQIKDGLPSNAVYGIVPDDSGHLWLSTNKGLSRLDPASGTFRNYDLQDGLQSNEFNAGAYARRRNGEILFGGINGLNLFHPDSIRDNPFRPPVVLTSFKRFNSDSSEGIAIVERGISSRHELILSHTDNIFTLEFAALSYRNPTKNQYAYRLKGFNDRWIYLGTKRDVTFTNLDPGEYLFQVKGSNSDGVWNDNPTELAITVTPPWWRTRVAYVFYGLLLIAGIFGVDRFQRRRLLRREWEKAREKELEQARQIEKAYKELDTAHENLKKTQMQLVQQEKMASLGQLTAGIAHEIKNPLNFVNNFAEVNEDLARELGELLKDKVEDPEVGDLLEDLALNAAQIAKHGKRADGIVRAMVQHASGGSGAREETAINKLVHEYSELAYHGRRAQIANLQVSMEYDLDPEVGSLAIIPQEIGRVVLNLVGNALDALNDPNAPVTGKDKPLVRVVTRRQQGGIEIRVIDNGPGIPENIRGKIFDPFFTTKASGSGTGLGLSLSFESITKGHGGKLRVESEPGSGATFIIFLPTDGHTHP
ncbi:MAG: hypothetical protein KDI06_11010 [Calditrichaeota bacterium]|nr:hypothetical protein [Calditrichota bacterium]